MTPRAALVALAIFAAVTSARSASARPLALTLALLAAIDLLRLATSDPVTMTAWVLDVLLVQLWTTVLIRALVPRMLESALVYTALSPALAYYLPNEMYPWVLRAPRVVLALLLTEALVRRTRHRNVSTVGSLILACGSAVGLVGTWLSDSIEEICEAWKHVTHPIDFITYASVAGCLVWLNVRRML